MTETVPGHLFDEDTAEILSSPSPIKSWDIFRKRLLTEHTVESSDSKLEYDPLILPDTVSYPSHLMLVYPYRCVGTVETQAACPWAPYVNDYFCLPNLPGIDPDVLQSKELFDILLHRSGGDLWFIA